MISFVALQAHLSLPFGPQAPESSGVCLQEFCVFVKESQGQPEGENNKLCLLLTGKSMSGAHNVPGSCDTQSLIDGGEMKILGLRGPWWEVVMCNAEPVASVLLSLFQTTLICLSCRYKQEYLKWKEPPLSPLWRCVHIGG